MPSSRSNNHASTGSSTHGEGARNMNSRSNRSLRSRLDREMGIEVDIPDLVNRIENGNQFTVGADINGLPRYCDNDEGRLGMSLLDMHSNFHKNFGTKMDVGRVHGAIDGVGVNYQASGVRANIALGPVDIGGKLGTAEAGLKLWEPGVGLDTGFKANASLIEANVGPVKGNVGIGFDTGVKFGREGVGAEFLGTGVQIGRETKFSLFGSSFGFKLW